MHTAAAAATEKLQGLRLGKVQPMLITSSDAIGS